MINIWPIRRTINMKNSCGAIFYAFDENGQLGVILGDEGLDETELWLPFKGSAHDDEPYELAAIREIEEETCGLVKLHSINLEHNFASKRKNYHIGLCEVSYSIVDQFEKLRKNETRGEYREKKKLKFFPLKTILFSKEIHSISRASIKYYWHRLQNLAICVKPNERLRCQGVTVEQAASMKEKCIQDIENSVLEYYQLDRRNDEVYNEKRKDKTEQHGEKEVSTEKQNPEQDKPYKYEKNTDKTPTSSDSEHDEKKYIRKPYVKSFTRYTKYQIKPYTMKSDLATSWRSKNLVNTDANVTPCSFETNWSNEGSFTLV